MDDSSAPLIQRRARSIVHVDMDAFYVSVELLRRPELQGRPVVVGGGGGRGVVAAASYEARRYGVYSAMSAAEAKRRCPEAVFLPGDHRRYGEVSGVLHEVFAEFTPIVEPIALDEAFLDVTGARRRAGSGVDIAWKVRQRVMERTGLACSLGVASNKLLAKLASEAAKPTATRAGVEPGAGVVEVLPGHELAFLHPLPVRALWGVGPRTAERLERRTIRTVGDLAAQRRQDLVALLGVAAGRHLWELAHGIDERPVESDRHVKSIGHEETFEQDLTDAPQVRAEVVRLADAVASRLRAAGVAARTVTLKIRRSDFSTVTRSVTPPEPLDTGPALVRALDPLIADLDLSLGVRLVGVSGSNLGHAGVQLRLEVLDAAAESDAARVVDRVRERFGSDAIGLASGLGRRGAPGEHPWGPGPNVT